MGAGIPSKKNAHLALGIGLIIYGLLIGLAMGFTALILSFMIAFALFFTFKNLVEIKIGGHTGDTLGAVQQITTLGLLIGLTSQL